jgi:sec-independent protein translocase protein TatB
MMPGIGFTEMILLAVVAIVVIGPKDLPLMMRKFGKFTGQMRALAFEFRQGLDELGRQAELEELRKEVASLKQATGVDELRQELQQDSHEFRSAVSTSETPAIAASTENSIGGGMPGPATPPPQFSPEAMAESQALSDTANGFDDDFRLEGHPPVAETRPQLKQDEPA